MKAITNFRIFFAIIVCLITLSQQVLGINIQTYKPGNSSKEIPEFFSRQFVDRTSAKNISKIPGHYSVTDWKQAIDSVWGPGLPTSEKLQIFDKFWGAIDSNFACFHNISVNWDSLGNVYRAEVSNGVSRGRFAAIITHLALKLRESHTFPTDNVVSFFTTPDPGVPLLFVGGWGQNGHFGAGLTPLPDSSLLVYEAVSSHPLGLVRGDIVLGYDHIPWKSLIKELIEAQLPMTGWWWGSSESSFNHSLLMSVGMNWHLFDTIDIVRSATGDTLHLPTSLLVNAQGTMDIFCTEQLTIPGVPKPNYQAQQLFSYGIIQGTNIGYIYGWGWFWNAQQEFLDAVQALMQTDGLIIDFRMNYGGNMFLSNPGLSLLFDNPTATIDFGVRCNPSDHELMCPINNPNAYIIPGSPPGYTKPIAVLTGPGAVSSGDQVALRMRFHPHAKLFGKSTSTAFNSPTTVELGNDWYFAYAHYDSYLLSNPNEYLTHRELLVDRPVWHVPSAAAQDKDNVVDAAKRWIDSSVTSVNELSLEIPNDFNLQQNYPNPFNPNTTIIYQIPVSGNVKIKVFDLLGREIETLVDEKQFAGSYRVVFNAGNLTSGVYMYQMQAGRYLETRKFLLIR